MPETQEPVSLSNICGIEEDFQRIYPTIVSSLKEGEIGSITISIQIKRIPDTSTMVALKATVTPKYPSRAKTATAQMNDQGLLKVDKPPEKKDNVRQLSLIDRAE